MNMTEQVETLLQEKKYRQLRDLLAEQNPADLAPLMEELEPTARAVAFRLLSKDRAAETFVELESDTQTLLIRSFSDAELKEIVDELYVDDAVDLIEEMPANVVRRILDQTDPETRRAINEILKYPDDTAGSLMTVEYVGLRTGMTVADAFANIRRTGIDKETIYNCYVVDDDRKLLGMVTAKSLMLAEQDEIIDDLTEQDIITVRTLEDKEEVARKFAKYDLLAIPVVDSEDRLVGIVTVDDAIDVIQEEATEDMEKMAAITPTDKSYLSTGVFETWWKRIPWLLLLMVSATITSTILGKFNERLAIVPILTIFIPMLMDTAGNAGGQSSVTVIRALSLGDVKMGDVFRVVWKELRVAFLCGICLAAVGFGKVILIDGASPVQALVVSLTMALTILVAKFVGCTLPILAKRIGLDPAVMAAPFITTIVDALSLLVYCNVAALLLHI
ncbi:MAG: magnesium transporter [Clostridia bacterium]|nr:magnesium transporter [Clostridia bacterium]